MLKVNCCEDYQLDVGRSQVTDREVSQIFTFQLCLIQLISKISCMTGALSLSFRLAFRIFLGGTHGYK